MGGIGPSARATSCPGTPRGHGGLFSDHPYTILLSTIANISGAKFCSDTPRIMGAIRRTPSKMTIFVEDILDQVLAKKKRYYLAAAA